MHCLFDFFPIALFFIAYKLWGIYLATGVAIAASLGQVTWQYAKHRRVEPNQLITLGLITVCGGATLFFHNDIFIKWKPTAIYWVSSIALLINQIWGKQFWVQQMMAAKLELTRPVWKQLQLSWIVFLISMGCLNLYVVYHFDTNTWVNFKFFGTSLLTLLFVSCQVMYISHQSKYSDRIL